MRTRLTKIAMAASLALAFTFSFQGCEDKEKQAREERRQVREQEKQQQAAELQQQAAELEKLKTELESEKKTREERRQVREQERQQQAAENARKAAVAKAAQERAANAQAVANYPSKYIQSVGGCTHNETGILNVYTNIQACNFVNSSNFLISNISGNIIVTTPNGTKTIPFRAYGQLNANQTNMLQIIGIQKVQIPGRFASSRVEVLKATVSY